VTPERPPALVRSGARSRIFLGLALGAFLLILGGTLLFRNRAEQYVPGADAGASAEITSRLARSAPGEAPRISFTDVAATAGIRFSHFHGSRSSQLPEDMGSGAAWGDYDGDGDPDLYLINIAGPLTMTEQERAASPAVSSLYRNDGGSFTDVTDRAGVGLRHTGMGAAWGDADGDGDLDLFVTSFGSNVLFRNEGDGTFKDVTAAAGLDAGEGFWSGASWADYDLDGDEDLYVCGYVRYRWDEEEARRTSFQYNAVVPFTLNPSTFPPERNLLFRNDGGRFTEVAGRAGVDNPQGRSLSAAWADFDMDGWPDLYIANDISDNAMFRNLGDGTFEDVSHASWVADYRGAMGVAVGDRDNDGDQDMFVAHWMAQENALYDNLHDAIEPTESEPMHFIDNADLLGLGQIALDFIGWGVGFLDYDNDGRLDLFVSNGSTFQVEGSATRLIPMKNLLFWNGGSKEGFFDVTADSGPAFELENVGRGAALADYDLDGDVDVLVVDHGGAARLLRNDGGANSWARVVVRGPAPSLAPAGNGKATTTFAVGALVKITTGSLTQVRVVGAGPSYLAQSPPGEVQFGLGSAGTIDRLSVEWPDGRSTVAEGLPVNTVIRVREGEEPAGAAPAVAAAAKSAPSREELVRFWATFREATSLRHAHRFPEAVATYQAALAIDPSHEDSLYYLGQCLAELGRPAEALVALERLAALNPESSRAQAALGSLRSLSGTGEGVFDLEAAERHFRDAIRINREETGSMIRLAEVLILRGELDEAGEWAEAAALTNHWSPEAPFLAGYVRWAAGDPAAAAGFYRKAVEAARPRTPVAGVAGEGDVMKPEGSPNAPPPESTMGETLFGDLAPAQGHPEADFSGGALEAVYSTLKSRAVDLAAGRP
jgi:Tfp pilus assembly protein PilF